MTKARDLAKKVRKRKAHATTTTTPELPTTPEDWIAYAHAKVAEHDRRPPPRPRGQEPGDPVSGWIQLADEIGRWFGR